MDSEKHQNNRSFVALEQEKAILEQNRRDELAVLPREAPKLFGLLDSRSLLLGYLTMGAVGNISTALEAGPTLTGLFYTIYAGVVFIGLGGLLYKNAMAICVYSAFATATFVFSLFLDGQILAAAFDRTADLCEVLLESSGSAQLTMLCHSHVEEVRWAVISAMLMQMGVDLLILAQLYRVFNWVVDEDDRRAARIALKPTSIV